MKRRLIAVALASMFAVPALALEAGPPFEQLQIDRNLPDIDLPAVRPYVADDRAPYDQLAVDRALPNLPGQSTRFAEVSGSGSTRSDASSAGEAAESPWANDHNFIAPPQ